MSERLLEDHFKTLLEITFGREGFGAAESASFEKEHINDLRERCNHLINEYRLAVRSSEVTGIENLSTTYLHQDYMCIESRVVGEQWRDLEWPNCKKDEAVGVWTFWDNDPSVKATVKHISFSVEPQPR